MAILLIITTLTTGFLLTYGSIPAIVSVSKIKKLFDVPNNRKLNQTVVPTLGGVGIFIGFSVSSLLSLKENSPAEIRYVAAAIIMMFFIGLKDDILIMAAKKKLLVQIAAALILVLGGNFRIDHAYGLLNMQTFSPWVSVPVSVMIILFLINAVNLIDGIDGLAAGLTLLVSSTLGTWFFLTDHPNYAILCAALSGSLIAFLRFNLSNGKNKTFMGDTGSLILGVFLAAICIKFNELNADAGSPFQLAQAPLFALALLIIPVTDTLRVFTVRIWHKRSPFSPDMNHFHHLLIRLGFSHLQATCFLLAYTAFFLAAAFAFSLTDIPINLSFSLVLLCSFAAVGTIWYRSKQLQTAKAVFHAEDMLRQIAMLLPKKNTFTVTATTSSVGEKNASSHKTIT